MQGLNYQKNYRQHGDLIIISRRSLMSRAYVVTAYGCMSELQSYILCSTSAYLEQLELRGLWHFLLWVFHEM